jgi:iron(II)-dependent oxidoreductase
MVTIEGGVYTLGHDDHERSARPEHQVTLSPFAIDRTEVTNAQYAEFLNALGLELVSDASAGDIRRRHLHPEAVSDLIEGQDGDPTYPLIALDDEQARIEIRDGRFVPAPGYEDHPVAETTWRGARDYCLWRGARLPTEAEWEAAARGGEGRLFPWGESPPTAERAYAGFRSGQTAPVGSRPIGTTPDGIVDLAGSLAEWTSTLARRYPYREDDGREDPLLPGERITRGGDYVYDTGANQLTTVFRDGFSRAPERGHRHIGFRCAGELESGELPL